MQRRIGLILLTLLMGTLLVAWLGSCEPTRRATDARLLVIGFDGMDPKLLKQWMAENKLPHFKRVAEAGTFKPLATSVPPQSPVAWSNVISGADAGAHQIFDFIHRDPNGTAGLPVMPYLSTSQIEAPTHDWAIDLGKWRIPLSSSKPILLRESDPFWKSLVKHGVDTAIYRMPANYPTLHAHGPGDFTCISGMGTPDLRGTYGEFTAFSADAPLRGKTVAGGEFVNLQLWNDRGSSKLTGPSNFMLKADKRGRVAPLTVGFDVVRDPEANVAKIAIGGHLVLLKPGEWSDWLPIDFETGMPGSSVLDLLGAPVSMPAMVRFHLKSIHPKLELYASPLNIDPSRPALPISVPEGFSRQLALATGLYYTTGIPQDTQALRADALDEDSFLQQANLVLEERVRHYRYALDHFQSGCLFYYFGSTDLLSHIFWRDRDPEHPGRDPEQGDRYADVIEQCYIRMDELVGEALEVLNDQDTLIILSDHGFTSFRRAVHLNTWLMENGYLFLKPSKKPSEDAGFRNVDWTRTKAYALGINSLFINLQGREREGIVAPGAEFEQLLAQITEKLYALHDNDGSRAIDTAYRVSDRYLGADPQRSPDLIIGYADHYRSSWSTALGGIATKLFEDNLDRWSGDHCVAAHLVPGILVTNRNVTIDDPGLPDIGSTILGVFGIQRPDSMTGRDLFAHAPP